MWGRLGKDCGSDRPRSGCLERSVFSRPSTVVTTVLKSLFEVLGSEVT